MTEVVVGREMAMIGKVLCVAVEPGTKIFDLTGQTLLGIVADRQPVINAGTNTAYLSTDDYRAAKAALPPPPKVLPGLPS